MKMIYGIGDRVTFAYEAHDGTVKDRFENGIGKFVYSITLDDGEGERFCVEEELKPYKEAVAYTYELEHLENMVIARFYEVKGECKSELCRGHGHIIHEGAIGVAQAASYALKKIYEKLGGEF